MGGGWDLIEGIYCGSEYEVQGSEPSHLTPFPGHPTSHSPFGSYTSVIQS